MDRLLNAYQEGLISLDQLRYRMPELRKQQQAVQTERQSLEAAAADHAHCLQLSETLTRFCSRLRLRADTLQVTERQKIVRLLVKEIVGTHLQSATRSGYRIPGPIRAECPAHLTHRSSHRRPNSAHITFCVQTVITPPGGVPASLSLTVPSSLPPASNPWRITFKTLRSEMRSFTNSIKVSLEMVSK